MQHLHPLDWTIVISLMIFFVFLGVRFRGKQSGGLAGFFLGGRNLPWYIAGVSMVATTFAADTPLWVTEKIAQHGVSGNWLWWNMLIGGMLTTFFFARLWRRANIITELELLEIRYSGPVARWLRGIRAVYLGLFMNVVIIGWVNAALISILEVFFEIPYQQAFWLCMVAMALVAIYSSIAGLLGIAITDFVQFIVAMTGSVILAVVVLNLPEVGGVTGLKQQLPAWRFQFFPQLDFGSSDFLVSTFSLSAGAFFSYLVLQWWASWYPGNEPGGGGYISQRMMGVKDEKSAVYASLFFQIAHYCLRPWPWIIVGLAALVLYPELSLEDSRKGFVLAMRDHLPVGLKGLLFVGFISAYMSTISTQLNWGSSYLTNDLYRRFIKDEQAFPDEEQAQLHYVKAGRLITLLIMLVAITVTAQIGMIDTAAQFLIASGAGLGMVLILRWYWWRISAWSELSATLAPFLGLLVGRWLLPQWFPESYEEQNLLFIFTVNFTSVVWLAVTWLTPPTDSEVLRRFYQRIKPGGWWKPFKEEGEAQPKLSPLLWSWLGGVIMAYSLLFAMGYFIFADYTKAFVSSFTMLLGLVLMLISMKRAYPGSD
jgi:Na+/proline symporter